MNFDRKTVDRLTNPFTVDQAVMVGRIIWGYNVEGLKAYAISRSKLSGVFRSAAISKERTNLAVPLQAFFLPELNQMVSLGYDPEAHVLVYVPRVENFNIDDAQKY